MTSSRLYTSSTAHLLNVLFNTNEVEISLCCLQWLFQKKSILLKWQENSVSLFFDFYFWIWIYLKCDGLRCLPTLIKLMSISQCIDYLPHPQRKGSWVQITQENPISETKQCACYGRWTKDEYVSLQTQTSSIRSLSFSFQLTASKSTRTVNGCCNLVTLSACTHIR